MVNILLKPLNFALRKALQMDTGEARARLMPLSGKKICLTVLPRNKSFYILVTETTLEIVTQAPDVIDLNITGDTSAFLSLITQGGIDEQAALRRFDVQGDMEVAMALKNVFKALDIDWEEHVSHITGDAIARTLSYQLLNLQRFFRKTKQHFHLDSMEYLRDELQVLATRNEVNDFVDQVSIVRQDAERAELRLRRLQQVSHAMRASSHVS